MGTEMGQLQPHGREHAIAGAAGVGGDGHGAAVEQGAKVITLHRQPGDGAGEHRRDRAVVFRRADHPARSRSKLGLQPRQARRWATDLGSRGEQRQVDGGEIEHSSAVALLAGGRCEALGQLEVMAVASGDHQHICGG